MAEVDLVSDLAAHFDATAIAAFHEYADNSSLSGQLSVDALRVWDLGSVLPGGKGLGGVFRYLTAIIRLVVILPRYDIVYIFFPGTLPIIAGLLCQLLRRRYGLYVRGAWMSRGEEEGYFTGVVLGGANFVVATGEGFRQRLVRKCRRVVNEVPLTLFKPGIKPHPRDFASPRLSLMFAGRLVESKGVLDIVRAVGLLTSKKRLDVRLVVVGGGLREESEAVEALASECGVRDRLTLLGHQSADEMIHCYSHADVFVFPSYYPEGFPRVLYEAMMFRIPIITTPMPGVLGFLEDGKNCVFCPPRSPHELAEAIARLGADRSLMSRLASCAASDVDQLFRGFEHNSHAEQVRALVVDAGR
ncbi:MAG: glycosyltransferase [Gammaproteobacteria bacterium]|nr:MAG: glycosyltransferase [Gammaproteobacteria bacterium]